MYLPKCLFTESIVAYDTSMREQEIKRQMTALHTMMMHERPTNDAAMLVEQEASVEPQVLSALIHKEVTAATHAKKIVDLQAAKAKKNSRGVNKSTTPSSKKTATKTQQSTKNAAAGEAIPKTNPATPSSKSGKRSTALQSNDQQAGGAKRGTSQGTKQSQKPPGNTRSKKAKSNSNKPSNKQERK
jgi:hypothetical protein